MSAETAREKVSSLLPKLPDDIAGDFIGWHNYTQGAVGAMEKALQAPLTDSDFPGAPTQEMQRAAAAIIHGALVALHDVANMPKAQ